VGKTLALLVSFCLGIPGLGIPAWSHDIYEVACCAGRDCRPIPASDVTPTNKGWLVRATGEIISYDTWPLKRSPDGQFHRCAAFNDFGPKGRTKCLYVPDMGE